MLYGIGTVTTAFCCALWADAFGLHGPTFGSIGMFTYLMFWLSPTPIVSSILFALILLAWTYTEYGLVVWVATGFLVIAFRLITKKHMTRLFVILLLTLVTGAGAYAQPPSQEFMSGSWNRPGPPPM